MGLRRPPARAVRTRAVAARQSLTTSTRGHVRTRETHMKQNFEVPNIVIAGGGFAGVWAAASAVRLLSDHNAIATVTLVSASDDLVIRPRLYESRPEDKRISLDRVLGPLGVHRIAGTVCGIDTNRRQFAIVQRDGNSFDLDYDRLVLATGSRLVRRR